MKCLNCDLVVLFCPTTCNIPALWLFLSFLPSFISCLMATATVIVTLGFINKTDLTWFNSETITHTKQEHTADIIPVRVKHTQSGHSLARCLLGDVTNGGSLLADDGTDVLCGYQQSQRDVYVLSFGGHPWARGTTAGPASGAIARSTAIIGPPLASLQLRVLIRDVGDTQGIVLKLVTIQLLDGSERDTDRGSFAAFGMYTCGIVITFTGIIQTFLVCILLLLLLGYRTYSIVQL